MGPSIELKVNKGRLKAALGALGITLAIFLSLPLPERFINIPKTKKKEAISVDIQRDINNRLRAGSPHKEIPVVKPTIAANRLSALYDKRESANSADKSPLLEGLVVDLSPGLGEAYAGAIRIETSGKAAGFGLVESKEKSGGGGMEGKGLGAIPSAISEMQVFELQQLDRIPKRLNTVAVRYPPELLRRGITGEVRLLVLLDEAGALHVIDVVSASDEAFVSPAVEAAEKLKYEPPTRNGEVVRAKFYLPIPFRILR